MTDIANDSPEEDITETDLNTEIETSFLKYGLSVVTSRALPDVRDGLKPVHRRILHIMNEDHVSSDRKTVKSARVVGSVLGKAHPHGDSAVYDALVKLAQPWQNRIPFVEGKGNFGSLGDEDPAAAARYCLIDCTKVRLADGTSQTLGQIAQRHGVTGPGEAPVDLKVLGAHGEPVRADRIFHSGTHPVRKLRTTVGHELTGTDNHPVLTLAPRGPQGEPELVWKRMDELAAGDRICVMRKTSDEWGTLTQYEADLALLFGAFVSEGWVTDRNVGFANTDHDFFTQVLGAFNRVVGEHLSRTREELLPSGKVLHRLSTRVGAFQGTPLDSLSGLLSGTQRIPDWVWESTPSAKAMFLAALFEGDGSARLADRKSIHITYSTESAQLAADVQSLLLELGVVAARNLSTARGRQEHRVAISNRRDARLFLRNVGFLTTKQQRLEEALDQVPVHSTAMSHDHVPYLAEWIRTYPPRGNREWLSHHNIDRIERWERDDEVRSRVPKSMLAKAEQLTDGTYFYAEVESVEDAGSADVYSLRVDTSEHAFVSDGIVSHNTECRLQPAAEAMLESIHEDTVDWTPNYDATLEEPTVLPAALPNLLINGTSGIAVGIACKFAPHNLSEVVKALCYLLEHPDATLDDLMRFLPAPDFPTGGVLYGLDGVRQAYETGRGSFKLRAKTAIEDVSARKKGIVATELPYGVGPESVMEKIVAIKRAGGLEGVANVDNYTDRHHGLRLVVEVKVGFKPEAVLAELFKKTSMETSFNINNVALVGLEPRQMGLIELCSHFLDHRVLVVTRRTKHRLRKAEARAHIVEGLIKAHDNIDEVVRLIKSSKSTKTANEKLRKTFKLSDVQAQSILEMTLRRLTGLELTALKDELADLNATIAQLNELLGSDQMLRDVVSKELTAAAKKFGSERKTEILEGLPETMTGEEESAAVEDEPTTVALDTRGNILKFTSGPETNAPLAQWLQTTTTSDIAAVTSHGRMFTVSMLHVGESPLPVSDYLSDLEEGESVVALTARTGEGSIVFATSGGMIKKMTLGEYPKRDGLPIIKLKDGDELLWAAPSASATEDLVLVTSAAKLLRTSLENIRAQGRTAAGVTGIKLPEGTKVVGAGLAVDGGSVITFTDGNTVKATPVDEYPSKGRGGAGVRCHNFKKGETVLTHAAVGVGAATVASKRTAKPVKVIEKRDGSGVKAPMAGDDLHIGFVPVA